MSRRPIVTWEDVKGSDPAPAPWEIVNLVFWTPGVGPGAKPVLGSPFTLPFWAAHSLARKTLARAPLVPVEFYPPPNTTTVELAVTWGTIFSPAYDSHGLGVPFGLPPPGPWTFRRDYDSR